MEGEEMNPDYKELRALEDRALEGPWDDVLVNVEVDGHTHCASYGDANSKFVRAARNALPGILDELDRLGKECAIRDSELDRIQAIRGELLNELKAVQEDREKMISEMKLTRGEVVLRDKLTRKLEEEREKLVAMLKATRHLMGGLHTLGWANMDYGPEAPKCISHSDFKYLLYNLQQPVDEALKACADIEPEEER